MFHSIVHNCKEYLPIFKSEEFFIDLDIDSVPKLKWKEPTSVEARLLEKCWRANNPEIFYRMLMVRNLHILFRHIKHLFHMKIQ